MVSPCSTISSCVTAVDDVVVWAGACAAAGAAVSAARSDAKHNVRTNTTPLFSGRVELLVRGLDASPRDLAPCRTQEPPEGYSYLLPIGTNDRGRHGDLPPLRASLPPVRCPLVIGAFCVPAAALAGESRALRGTSSDPRFFTYSGHSTLLY